MSVAATAASFTFDSPFFVDAEEKEVEAATWTFSLLDSLSSSSAAALFFFWPFDVSMGSARVLFRKDSLAAAKFAFVMCSPELCLSFI